MMQHNIHCVIYYVRYSCRVVTLAQVLKTFVCRTSRLVPSSFMESEHMFQAKIFNGKFCDALPPAWLGVVFEIIRVENNLRNFI